MYQKNTKKFKDSRRETFIFLARRPRLGHHNSGVLDGVLGGSKKVVQKVEAYLLVLAQFLKIAIQNPTAMVLTKTLFCWPKLGFCEQILGAKLLSFWREGR